MVGVIHPIRLFALGIAIGALFVPKRLGFSNLYWVCSQ